MDVQNLILFSLNIIFCKWFKNIYLFGNLKPFKGIFFGINDLQENINKELNYSRILFYFVLFWKR